MSTPSEIPVMLHETATIGTAMSAVTIAAWRTILAMSNYMSRMAALRNDEPLKKPSFSS